MQRIYRPHFNREEPVVRDLREKLNRMRQEKTPGEVGIRNPPPPDPAYSFLKDPLRGDDCAKSSHERKGGFKNQNMKTEMKADNKNKEDEQKNPAKPIERSPQGNRNANSYRPRGPPRGWQTQSWGSGTAPNRQSPRKFNEKATFQGSAKQHPVNNIKVEVSSESGERKCIIDDTMQVQIPVSPNKNYTVKPKSGKWLQHGPPKYYAGNKSKRRSPSKNEKNEKDELGAVVVEENKMSSVLKGENREKVEKGDDTSGDSKTKPETVHEGKKDLIAGKKEEKKSETTIKEGEEETKPDVMGKNDEQTIVKKDDQQKSEE